VRSNFGLKARLLGTEFLDAEIGRQKSSRKRANACRDQSPGSKWPEIPAEAPYLASTRERVVCGGWVVEAVGHKLATHHPVIEPVSAAEPGKCEKACGSLSPTTGWWRWYGSNWLPPTQSYRTASLSPP
jgi:hypothetical protein